MQRSLLQSGRWLVAGVLLSFLAGCQTQPVRQTQPQACEPSPPVQVSEPKPAPPEQHDNLNAVLWMQKSAEYRALARQAFRMAEDNLERALADRRWTAALEQVDEYENLPPAVILDVDETVLDNSRYQAWLIRKNKKYSSISWDWWISTGKAEAIPGALEFIRQARKKGVRVFLVSNRSCRKRKGNTDPCPQKRDIIANLERLGLKGIGPKQILLRGERKEWGSEKKDRRFLLSVRYRILMLFGDDLGDFIPGVRKLSWQKRAELVEKYRMRWGVRWYMLPNPSYGSWQRVLGKPSKDMLRAF